MLDAAFKYTGYTYRIAVKDTLNVATKMKYSNRRNALTKPGNLTIQRIFQFLAVKERVH